MAEGSSHWPTKLNKDDPKGISPTLCVNFAISFGIQYMYIYSSIHLSLVPSQSLTSKQIDGSHLWHHLGLDRYCKYIFPQDSECGKLDRFFRWFDGLTSCDTALNLLNLGPVGPTKRAGRQLWHPSKCESQVPKSCRICDLIFVCLDRFLEQNYNAKTCMCVLVIWIMQCTVRVWTPYFVT